MSAECQKAPRIPIAPFKVGANVAPILTKLKLRPVLVTCPRTCDENSYHPGVHSLQISYKRFVSLSCRLGNLSRFSACAGALSVRKDPVLKILGVRIPKSLKI